MTFMAFELLLLLLLLFAVCFWAKNAKRRQTFTWANSVKLA